MLHQNCACRGATFAGCGPSPSRRTARVGEAYRYQPRCLASIGHLACKGGYNAAFWDRERLAFSLEQAPGWLKVAADTGEVTGMPDAPGEHEVVLAVTNGRGNKAEQRFRLRVEP